ncbi:MAG: GspH/FimT family pseudopilin [Oceanospirillaceae bacterium]
MAQNTMSFIKVLKGAFYEKPAADVGYSLVELLMSLAIIASLLFLGIPRFNDLLMRSQLEKRVSQLLIAVKEAKLAAIKSNLEIVICRRALEHNLCHAKAAKGSQSWKYGWLVFVDYNRDKMYQNTDKLVKITKFNDSRCEVIWNRGDYLSFYQFGLLKGSRAGSFKFICGDIKAQLVINWVGRIRREA